MQRIFLLSMIGEPRRGYADRRELPRGVRRSISQIMMDKGLRNGATSGN
jgi:hypothetical protein